MEALLTSENLIALLTLTALEVVLGIDNVVFISILVGKLPPEQRERARKIGLGLAMISRILLLLSLSWVMQLKTSIFSIAGHPFSGRDLILLVGGLFLIGKSTFEIHDKLEGAGAHGGKAVGAASYASILVQIAILDIVFSLDSVITAIGMAQHVGVMITAVVIAVIVMLAFARAISVFIDRHPTMKVLALSFLLLIGVMLVAEGWGNHIEKGYIYFAMAFSVFVEFLNLRLRGSVPVELHQSYVEELASREAPEPTRRAR